VKNPLKTKLYYSISEVAEVTDLQPYTLRSWEKEFSCLRPKRMGGKNRAYKERDIGIVLLIKYLLYEARYTSQGVKQRLKNEPELIQVVTGNAAMVHQAIYQGAAGIQTIAAMVEERDEADTDRKPEKEIAQAELNITATSENVYKKLLQDTRLELRNILEMIK